MSLSPESKQKLSVTSKAISNLFKISIIGIAAKFMFIFLQDGYLFVTHTPPDPPYVNREIYRILRHQKNFYIEHGRFANKYADLSTEDAKLSQANFEVEMKVVKNKLIVYVHDKFKNKGIEKTSFGIVNPIKQKHDQLSNQDSNFYQERFLSLVCSSENRGISQPTDIQFNKISDQCPSGYNQYFANRDTEYLPAFNIRSILEWQFKIYRNKRKFTESLPRDPDFFIASDPEKYQYQIQSEAEKTIVIAQPKLSENNLKWKTYLVIATVNTNQKKIFTTRYCESEIKKVTIPTISDIAKLSKDCPTGYRPQF